MTFEKLLNLKQYMQFHSDEFQSLKLLVPVLELWHLEWMDLTRIFQAHWSHLMTLAPCGTVLQR